jgi:hypothetical protein
MAQQVKTKVPLVLDTVSKCLCPGCPVQEESICVADLKSGLKDNLKKKPLKHEEVPAVYCGAGKATCSDLDPSNECICPGCAVYARYHLAKGEPDLYFCQEGESK